MTQAMFRAAKWIFVGDQHRRADLAAKFRNTVAGISSQNKAHMLSPQFLANLIQALHQERIVAKICVGDRNQCEENRDRFAERIADLDRSFQRRIVDSAKRTPHPVHDANAVRIGRATATNANPWITSELLQKIHSENSTD